MGALIGTLHTISYSSDTPLQSRCYTNVFFFIINLFPFCVHNNASDLHSTFHFSKNFSSCYFLYVLQQCHVTEEETEAGTR